jgi:hypothetical protein
MTTLFEEVGDALRDDPLYVDSDARDELAAAESPFGSEAEDTVRSALQGTSEDIYIAVLPMDVKEESTINDIMQEAGMAGTYLVLFPDTEYSTGSDVLPLGEVRRAASDAHDAASSVDTFLLGFVNGVESLSEPAGQDDTGGGGALPLAILAAVGAGGFLVYRRNKRHRELADLDQVRIALEEDITAYGEELIDLDVDVRAAAEPIESQQEYARALDLYENAKTAAEHAEKPGHLRPVTSSLEEGRWLLTRVRARRNGEAPPDRRPPCFFDPRHGPSVEDIAWAPPSGVARQVPACAADATRIRDGHDPDARMVEVNGERRPYWEAGPAYNAWAGGYYGAVLPAMFIGTMLGSNAAYAAHGSAGEGGWGGDGGYDGGGGFDGGYDGGGGFDGGFDGGGFGGGFDGGF